MQIDDFHLLHGKTIMYCQIIENDVKLIYAAILKGDMNETFEMIEQQKWTLGKTITKLKELDYSDDDHYISAGDYNFLRQMTEKRNHWCHQSYIEFIYAKDYESSIEYKKECSKLIRDNERLSKVYLSLERIRLQAMKDFNRT